MLDQEVVQKLKKILSYSKSRVILLQKRRFLVAKSLHYFGSADKLWCWTVFDAFVDLTLPRAKPAKTEVGEKVLIDQ